MADSLHALLRHPRFGPHALSALPAWVWSTDATRLLWCNPVAAAITGADDAVAGEPAARQIARIAAMLPHSARPRFERLRGLGSRFGGALTCACSRVVMPDQTAGILVTAVEPATPRLSPIERARALLGDSEEPLALYAADRSLLHATLAARAVLDENSTRIGALLTQALALGRAEAGPISAERIGADVSAAVLVSLRQLPGMAVPAIAGMSPAAVTSRAPAAKHHHPLRLVWQMGADSRFAIGTEEFINLVGPKTAAKLAQRWEQLNVELGLDPEGQVARAVGSRETWSGITVSVPVDDASMRLAVELSGLPVFDRNRNYRGYRGFGICRDMSSIEALLRHRQTDRKPSLAPHPTPAPSVPPVERSVLREDLPALSLVPAAENVLPFRATPQPDRPPSLTPVARKAFRDLGSRLTARLRGLDSGDASDPPLSASLPLAESPPAAHALRDHAADRHAAAITPHAGDPRPILDRLPVGILVYRLDKLIYANRAFLNWTGYNSVSALEDAGGLDALFVEPRADAACADGTRSLAIATQTGERLPVDARLITTLWDGESALVLMLASINSDGVPKRNDPAAHAALAEANELRPRLDGATDGVGVPDRDAKIVALNRSAEILFGYQSAELAGMPFAGLFAPDGQHVALDRVAALSRPTNTNQPEAGRELTGRARSDNQVPLFMAMERVADGTERLCAVFRDLTLRSKAEAELRDARHQAERASAAKSEFLAKVNHEIRTPLNSIIGFAEVMLEERLGPVTNERYRQYLKHIHDSSGHLMSLLNDLLDLSQIEAGKLPLAFARIDLNALIQQCVALMQPQARQARIIVRTALADRLNPVVADLRSVRQILLNLLSNSIKFTGAGGQVIISTAKGGSGETILRVRDTGVGMSEREAAIALEPFRQLASTAQPESLGTGLGLPLTKALAEVNRATFQIRSAVHSGTLVEIAFSGDRNAAE